MFSPKSLAVFLPILLPYLLTTVNGAPTSANATDLIADIQLDKRDIAGWINTFADVGCHVPVGHYTRLDNAQHCVNWDSNQPGLYCKYIPALAPHPISFSPPFLPFLKSSKSCINN